MRRALLLALALAAPAPLPARAADAPRPPPRDRWIAIAPAAWLAALETLAALRRGALDVEVVSLEGVLARGGGSDAPERREERLFDLVPTDSWYPPSIFFQGMKFVVFGDPALPMP